MAASPSRHASAHRLVATLRRTLLPALRPITFLLLALGSAFITVGSLAYFDDEEWPAFVIEKLPLPREELWIFALQVHVVVAAIALPGCLLLMSRFVLRRHPHLHRWLGRVVGVVVLGALVPSGSYLALYAKGGLPSTVGFLLSGVIVAVAMVQGVRTARARAFLQHRRAVLHVVAQLSVAVTSRAMLFAFDAVAADPEAAYLISLWVPVIGSVLVVEALCLRWPAAIPKPLPLAPRSVPLATWRSSHALVSPASLLAAQPRRPLSPQQPAH